MRRSARIDRNQPEIVEALRKLGASVQPLHTAHDGIPDLLVGYQGRNFLLEVKDGTKPPSALVCLLLIGEVGWIRPSWSFEYSTISTPTIVLGPIILIQAVSAIFLRSVWRIAPTYLCPSI